MHQLNNGKTPHLKTWVYAAYLWVVHFLSEFLSGFHEFFEHGKDPGIDNHSNQSKYKLRNTVGQEK